MIVSEHTSLADLSGDSELREALAGLAEMKSIVTMGSLSGLSDAEVSELALEAQYLDNIAMSGLEGFFKKAWRSVRKRTHKIRYKALKVIRKVAPVVSMLPVVGIPFAIAYAGIEAQQAYQAKRTAKKELKTAKAAFDKVARKEEKAVSKEEKESEELYQRTKEKIASDKVLQERILADEEAAAQVLLERARSEFGPRVAHIVKTAEGGGEITVPTSRGDVPIPAPPKLTSSDLPPGITAAHGGGASAESTTSPSTKPGGLSTGVIVGGGVAAGGLLILMMAMKKKKKKR